MSPRPKKFAKPIVAQMKATYKPKGDRHSFGEAAKTVIRKQTRKKKP